MRYKIYILMGIFLLLIPLGLLTEYPAWGEWELEFYEKTLGFIPEGMKHFKGFNSLIPDYSIDGLNPVVSYYISAFIGIGLIFGAFYMLKIFIGKSSER
ncbi:MAG: cobalamin biosynthesis protein [Aquificae bacterium]|nr:cobalamin biosynthesis protein [Aquificota bacterium]